MTTRTNDATGLDALSPATHQARDAAGFRAIRAAMRQVEDADHILRDAVRTARAAGDSLTVIGAALGTTRQAAFQRFGQDC